MEDLLQRLTNGNLTEVKVALASVVAALAVYQLVLAAVVYGRLRPAFLGSGPAALTHRASGDAIVVLVVLVGIACLSYGELEDDASIHAVAGWALAAVLVLKIVVVRWWHAAGRLLPYLGTTLFALLALTWATTARPFLF
ncbi:DUF6529 family protein [Patulibacter brassicae]|uniref:DUF6529 family protein n=1 Tax=Patulibacter brassicae TaxID=1705717 RepID=A0ABU4VP76_9ACTN|nr:DUF6529 family protein [Patulibacter brassicae]MDX8153666.1 DUF6529 family protein [Patulibacter brassicae]